MGKQVRKVMPWTNMAEAHLVTGHVIHKMYRWSTCKIIKIIKKIIKQYTIK
jgi:hypothetical protein